ncbi:MAG TPA: proprotein convertase P-domain-containing protein, partial [Solirubrobacterales bacterium]|nr:proprotein convertase P-domain-containing protein [Solirubrobacterales bacterium]
MHLKKTLWLGILGALAALLTSAPVAAAETLTATQTTDTTIPASGNGSPYPNTLNLETADGNMTDVNISVTLSHTFPGDIDLAIVSPDGDSEVLMSDACGGADLASVTINFDSEAGSALPNESCSGGTFQPTNFAPADSWPAPGPGSPTTTQLNNFNGEDPNGQWQLFVVDDEPLESGTILQWSVTVTTLTAELVVPGVGTSGIASPYPSTKTFDTPPGTVISDLNFHTPDFNHLHP